MEKLRGSPGDYGYLYHPHRDYITRNKESARDPSPASSTQSLGDGETVNHPESMDSMDTDRDTVAYLVASTIDGKSAGQLSCPQNLLGQS